MMTENEKLSLVSEGILIAGISGYSYLLAFVFEFGYCSVLGVPISLIVIDLTSVFIVVGIIFCLFSGVIFLIEVLHACKPEAPSVYHRITARNLAGAIFAFLMVVAFGSKWAEYASALILVVIMALSDFLLPLIFYSSLKTYKEKLEAGQKDSGPAFPITQKLFNRIGPLGSWVGYLLLLMVLFHSFGRSYAYGQDQFYEIHKEEPLVLLRVYGDRFVFAKIDPEGNQVKEIRILTDADVASFPIILKKVGPLAKMKSVEARTPSDEKGD